MNSSSKHNPRKGAPAFLSPPPKIILSASWREGATMGAGVLVMLVTAWLIWAALAEAALALAGVA